MNGRDATLGIVAGLAVASVAASRRGSRATISDPDTLARRARVMLDRDAGEAELQALGGILGCGVGRCAFPLGEQEVLKVAYNASGEMANQQEAFAWESYQGTEFADLLVPVRASDPGGLWLVMDRAVVQRPFLKPVPRAFLKRLMPIDPFGRLDTDWANLGTHQGKLRLVDYGELHPHGSAHLRYRRDVSTAPVKAAGSRALPPKPRAKLVPVSTKWPTWPAMRRFLEERWRWEDLSDAERAARRAVGVHRVDRLGEWEYRVIGVLHNRLGADPARRAEAEVLAWKDVERAVRTTPLHRFKEKKTIRIWRKVWAPSAVEIRMDGLGIFWSWNREGACAYWPKQEDRPLFLFLIEGVVKNADVNWLATIIKDIAAPEEQEIELQVGVPVLDVSIAEVEAWNIVRRSPSGTANRGTS